MEKTNIPYEEWPEWIKATTAFYAKSLILKNPKLILWLSAINISLGFVLLAQHHFYFGESEFMEARANFAFVFLAAINIVLGLFNIFSSYRMYNWIYTNSSWEERFAHKSSGKHQFQYFLMWIVLVGISLGIACIFCC